MSFKVRIDCSREKQHGEEPREGEGGRWGDGATVRRGVRRGRIVKELCELRTSHLVLKTLEQSTYHPVYLEVEGHERAWRGKQRKRTGKPLISSTSSGQDVLQKSSTDYDYEWPGCLHVAVGAAMDVVRTQEIEG